MDKDKLNQNILTAFGLDKLPKERKQKLVLRIGEVVFKRIMARVLQELDEKKQKDFEELFDKKPYDGEAVFEFLKSNVDDFENLVEEEISDFRKEALSVIEKQENKD
jgi:hypothetical protein